MKKKFIVINVVTRSFLNRNMTLGGNIKDACKFDTREEAECAAELTAGQSHQQTPENERWCYGFALTVLEVYV